VFMTKTSGQPVAISRVGAGPRPEKEPLEKLGQEIRDNVLGRARKSSDKAKKRATINAEQGAEDPPHQSELATRDEKTSSAPIQWKKWERAGQF